MATFRDEADYTTGFEPTIFDTPTIPTPSAPGVGDSTAPASGSPLSFPSLPSDLADVRSEGAGISSSERAAAYRDPAFYEPLERMSAAAIEAAFSGNDGSLREEPDAFHREADARLHRCGDDARRVGSSR